MTALERVQNARRFLAGGVFLTALLAALGLALAFLGLAAGIDRLFPLPYGLRIGLVVIGVALGLGAAALICYRGRGVRSVENVAIWYEERRPSLEYVLVTAVGRPSIDPSDPLERIVAGEWTGGIVSRAVFKAIGLAGGLLLVGLALATLLPPNSLLRPAPARAAAKGNGGSSTEKAAPSRLENLKVKVTPPAYAGLATQSLDDPSGVSALPGSQIVIEGKGAPDGVHAKVVGANMAVTGGGDRWELKVVMPAKPGAVELTDREFQRVLVLAPMPDVIPSVVLLAPKTDTVLASIPTEPVFVSAVAGDDYGLATGYFEYIVTTGAGEQFKSTTHRSAVFNFRKNKRDSLATRLSLPSLDLKEGDVVLIRAVALDANDVTGPGMGVSDARTIRIKRKDEDDSVSIDPIQGLEVDTTLVSQRMLNIRAETLYAKRPRPARKAWVKQSIDMARIQEEIRYKVMAVVYQNTESSAGADVGMGGGAPGGGGGGGGGGGSAREDDPLAVLNKYLIKAAEYMMDASMDLNIAEVGTALPNMRLALIYLDSARIAKRYYLRGFYKQLIVDIQKMRLQGTFKGESNERNPVVPTDSARRRLLAGLEGALALLAQPDQRDKALVALGLLHVNTIANLPAVAVPLGEVIDAIRAGRDPKPAFLKVRRALDGPVVKSSRLSRWAGGL